MRRHLATSPTQGEQRIPLEIFVSASSDVDPDGLTAMLILRKSFCDRVLKV